MTADRQDQNDAITRIDADEDGRVVVVVDGRIAVFDVDSTRMRKFTQELIEAAVRKDMRT